MPEVKASQLVSLQQDNKNTTYCASDQRAFRFILARDVLCGLLPGPCPLGANGPWKQYISPMIGSWAAWQTQDFYQGPGTDVWETFTEALRHVNASFSNLQKQ
ncbi:hypothetical protein BDZ89DRAFT_559728 [Hymenopellis radicata]|nr:hypothetical protein BDZ89DRAFT_559728 [Hymenopellis radicata]